MIIRGLWAGAVSEERFLSADPSRTPIISVPGLFAKKGFEPVSSSIRAEQ
jgi:hypothetical protein